jgi:dTDP-4-amino-4,6-dideoxygalactose transaminase
MDSRQVLSTFNGMREYKHKVRLSDVRVNRRSRWLVNKTLKAGRLASGTAVLEFEEAVRKLAGAKHFAAVSNGTSALALALRTTSLRPGEEVITTPFTFGATWNAILSSGAALRIVDINQDDFNMNLSLLPSRINSRTRVVVPVHLYGLMCDLPELRRIVETRGIRIVEDCAQALGATSKGIGAGVTDIGTFSFYATKNLTTGEGGGISCASPEDVRKIQLLRNQGFINRYEYELLGENHRMTDVAACIGLGAIEGYGAQLARRRANAKYLTEGLSGLSQLYVPKVPDGREHVWHQFTVVLASGNLDQRASFSNHLASRGIESGIYYPRPLYDYQCFRHHPMVILDEPTPIADRVSRSCISIPVHPRLTKGDLDRIIESIHEFFPR